MAGQIIAVSAEGGTSCRLSCLLFYRMHTWAFPTKVGINSQGNL